MCIASELSKKIRKGRKIRKRDLLDIPAIANNPLSATIIRRYTTENLDFEVMVRDLQMFISPKDSYKQKKQAKDNSKNDDSDLNFLDSKLKFLYRLYDVDDNGCIGNAELYNLVYTLCEGKLDGWKVQNLVDQTFRLCDGRIDFFAFKDLIMKRTTNLETFFITN